MNTLMIDRLSADRPALPTQQMALPEISVAATPPVRKTGATPKNKHKAVVVVKAEATQTTFSDPAFATNKTLPIHRWVPWIAGFASDFVDKAIGRYLPEKGTILDPFSGVGTTLVEAMLNGHDAVAFEINPYAALASRTKANAHHVDPVRFCDEIARFQAFYEGGLAMGYIPRSLPPPGFKTRGTFYHQAVLKKVLVLQDFIDTIPAGEIRDLFRVAFAATMVRYSNYSYEPSLGQRVSSGKPEIHDFAVSEAVMQKLNEMADDTVWFEERLNGSDVGGRVINDTFFNYEKHLPEGEVDLIITSPPYLNNYHYNRNTRPQLYWLGYADEPSDLKELEHANFGKYWQTVREETLVDLEFALPNTDLAERLAQLRAANPQKKRIYSGHGWANYAASYFNDCVKLAQGIRHSLRPGGTALVVIGNSILQGIMIPTDEYFGRIAESIGLELVNIDIPRATRVGNSIISSNVRVGVETAETTNKLYEAVVELRRR